MSRQLVDSFASDFTPEKFTDDYQEQLRTLVEAKLEQGDALDTEATFGRETEGGGEVLDLMEALKRSVAAQQAARRRRREEPAREEAREAAAKKTALPPKPNAQLRANAEGPSSRLRSPSPHATSRGRFEMRAAFCLPVRDDPDP